MSASSGRTAVFTIVSKNYLHYARVLMRSVRSAHPDWDRVVLLADTAGNYFEPAAEPFEVVEIRTLDLPNPEQFTFRYTILELNTAVKPWFFRALFMRGYDRVIYLDPDIVIYRPMAEVEDALGSGALAVLVPHLTGRILDELHPGEHEILQSGAYNLGFCALARHSDLDGLLDFWCEKSERLFVVDLQRGLFTDQRWMDLVPGMFRDVRILRHEGYDVAYWNLPHRHLRRSGPDVLVNEVPLVFFHFSGVEPHKPGVFSKHQDRYRLQTAGVAGDLTIDYCKALQADGLETCERWPYAYGLLEDGSPVADVLRHLYRTTPEIEAWCGPNPFARTCKDWNTPIDDRQPPLTRAMLAVYRARPDLRLTWPDVHRQDRDAFVRWFCESQEPSQLLPSCYVGPICDAVTVRPTETAIARSRSLPPTEVNTALLGGALRKAYVAAREGRLPLSPRRWLQLYRLHVREQARDEFIRQSPALPPVQLAAGDSVAEGMTIVGYLADGTGISAGAHASSLACTAAGIPYELLDARPLAPRTATHPVRLIHVNADQMSIVGNTLGEQFFDRGHTIGVWAWELEELPDAYLDAFDWLDEIWAPSAFVQSAVADKSPVPVVHIPYPVTAPATAGLSRSHFGLPDDHFLFLTMYDVLSVQERKNPLGALAAFAQAFPRPHGVSMVVRVNHAASRPDDVAALRRAVNRTAGAILIETPFSREDALALQAMCDAFVSLHRSEGFGLNIAEAMLLGKPAVATAWSGNMDFMTPGNSGLVDYALVTLADDHGPYRRGQRWANPDLDHAAHLMQRVFGDRDYRTRIAARGQATIAAGFSPTVIGERYRRRLGVVRQRRRPSQTTR